jgi:P-type Cu2+ transporter
MTLGDIISTFVSYNIIMIAKISIPLINVLSEHGASTINEGLEEVEGIKSRKVEIDQQRVLLEVDSTKIGVLASAVSKLRDLGYMVATTKGSFPVIGMTCASCAISVENILNSQSGVVNASVNFASNMVLVEYIPEEISKFEMKVAIQSVGYDVEVGENEDTEQKVEELKEKRYRQIRLQTIGSIALSVPLIVIGMFYMHGKYANFLMWGISTPIVLVFGRQFFINAWKQLKRKTANMDTLVALSTGIAYLFSVFNTLYPKYWHDRGMHAEVYFESAGVVVAFILLGKLLEERAKQNTSTALKKLIGLQPKTVIKINANGSQVEIPVSLVQINDALVVKPGEKIPVDGIVTYGYSSIDESSITGEPIPSEKKIGDKIFAGTINQKGSLQIVAEKVGESTVLAQIIKVVQEAQGSKAPIQRTVDKIASFFVPLVIGIAVLTFITWLIFGGEDALTHALLSAITVLVIACPCALGLATPTALMVGIGKAAAHGILIKDAESLEQNKKIDAIILDKTGTITLGKPEVTDMIWGADSNNKKYANILHEIEKQSEHPLAEAIIKYLNDKIDTEQSQLDRFESVTGKGVIAYYNGLRYIVGNQKIMKENKVVMRGNLEMQLNMFLQMASTIVLFAEENEVIALIAINDKIKNTSAKAIKDFHAEGMEVYMLTGDNSKTAQSVAEKVGVKYFKADVLPGEKADFVKELQAKGKVVAMVGDGINDSQALAQADVSIAMGKGSDIAIDVAKMTIISSDLTLIPKAIKLSKQTDAVIKQNLFWAFIYNIIGIPIAAGIMYPINGFLLNPMIAGAAMALSSVSVIGNSLLLKFRTL